MVKQRINIPCSFIDQNIKVILLFFPFMLCLFRESHLKGLELKVSLSIILIIFHKDFNVSILINDWWCWPNLWYLWIHKCLKFYLMELAPFNSFNPRSSSIMLIMKSSIVISEQNFLEIMSNFKCKLRVDDIHLFANHYFNVWVKVGAMWCGMTNNPISLANHVNSFILKLKLNHYTIILS